MSAPWHGKAHFVIADSAFSSVDTAVALKQHGTYFIGIVKTAHKTYPKQFMGTHHDFSRRGDHVELCANVQGPSYLLLDGWMARGKTWCSLVAQHFQVLLQHAHTRRWWLQPMKGSVLILIYAQHLAATLLPPAYFDNFHCIDVHDHMHQSILKLEQHWLTQNRVYRVLSTLFGVIVTDCYYASIYIHPAEMSGVDFHEYVDRLAYQSINSAIYAVRASDFSNAGIGSC